MQNFVESLARRPDDSEPGIGEAARRVDYDLRPFAFNHCACKENHRNGVASLGRRPKKACIHANRQDVSHCTPEPRANLPRYKFRDPGVNVATRNDAMIEETKGVGWVDKPGSSLRVQNRFYLVS